VHALAVFAGQHFLALALWLLGVSAAAAAPADPAAKLLLKAASLLPPAPLAAAR
jgi:hypothetical protein